MKSSRIIPLDDSLALAAADTALKEKLAMADAIIYSTAHINNCIIITSDVDLKDLRGVEYIGKN
jgi:predicted nucleic acid-binding protein